MYSKRSRRKHFCHIGRIKDSWNSHHECDKGHRFPRLTPTLKYIVVTCASYPDART